jgi:hypothetical protein
LSVDGVVGLKDDSFIVSGLGIVVVFEVVGPVSGFELEGSMVGVDSNSGLRYPRQCLCKAIVDSIKEDTAESKRICDRAISSKVLSYSVVPGLHSWMETKPSFMKPLCVDNQPAALDSCSSRRAAVVNTVDGMFAFLSFVVSGVAAGGETGELSAPHVFGVLDVNINSSPERRLEIIVLSFPGDDLGVGPFKVGFELEVAGVGCEDFADVWEGNAERHVSRTWITNCESTKLLLRAMRYRLSVVGCSKGSLMFLCSRILECLGWFC